MPEITGDRVVFGKRDAVISNSMERNKEKLTALYEQGMEDVKKVAESLREFLS